MEQVMMHGAGMWGGMENAPTFDRGSYFQPGFQGQVELIRCFPKETQNSGLQFLAECKVLISNMQAHPAGSQATWFQSMKDPKVYLPALKMFVYAVLDIVDDMQARTAVDPYMPAIMNWVSGTPNGFGSYIVNLSTVQVPKKDKNPFTRHDWAQVNYKTSGRKGPDIQAVIQAALPYANIVPQPQRSGPTQGGGMFGGGAPGGAFPPNPYGGQPLNVFGTPAMPGPPGMAPPPFPQAAPSQAPVSFAPWGMGGQTPGMAPPPFPQAAPPQPPPPAAPPVQVSPDGHWKLVNGAWVPNR